MALPFAAELLTMDDRSENILRATKYKRKREQPKVNKNVMKFIQMRE